MRDRRRGWLAVVALTALTLALGACSPAAPGGGPAAGATEEGASGGDPAGAGARDRGAISREELQAILDDPLSADPGPDGGGLALQEHILADGLVTADEYERAVVAAADCVRREGFTIEGPARYPDAPVYRVMPGADPRDYLEWAAIDVVDDDRFDDVAQRCMAQWSERVERVWQAQHEPSEQEVQEWLERAWACAREAGLALSDPPTLKEADLSIGHGCRPWEPDD